MKNNLLNTSMRSLLLSFVLTAFVLAGCDSNGGSDGELIIQDLEEGDGDVVESGDAVMVSYEGKLEDGSVFDASDLHDVPLAFTVGVGQVIEGWDQGLLGMREGGTRRLVIPPKMAYGRQGVRGSIPGNETITFVITLDKILDDVYTEDRVVGEGATAELGKVVTVDYLGTLTGGEVFDSSQNFTFELGGGNFIEGWNRGILGMRVGGSRLIVIPYQLAYGAGGNGFIPPFAVLTFEVDLTDVSDGQ